MDKPDCKTCGGRGSQDFDNPCPEYGVVYRFSEQHEVDRLRARNEALTAAILNPDDMRVLADTLDFYAYNHLPEGDCPVDEAIELLKLWADKIDQTLADATDKPAGG